MMRKTYNNQLKAICHNHIVSERVENNLSQTKMAEILMMDLRSYADIESGKSCCSLLTFILFVIFFCIDTNEIVDEIKIAFEESNNEVA